jgi:hypothetical protein
MTITSPFTSPSSTSPSTDVTPDVTGPLRLVLRLDASGAAVSGLVLVLAAGPLARLADVAAVGVVRLIGLGLLVLAVDLVLLARSRPSTLVRFTPLSAMGDVAWMVTSFVVAAAVEMNSGARVVVLAQGIAVGGVALAKLVARHRIVRAGR